MKIPLRNKKIYIKIILIILPGNGVKLAKSVNDFSRLCLCQNSIPSAFKQKKYKDFFKGMSLLIMA